MSSKQFTIEITVTTPDSIAYNLMRLVELVDRSRLHDVLLADDVAMGGIRISRNMQR